MLRASASDDDATLDTPRSTSQEQGNEMPRALDYPRRIAPPKPLQGLILTGSQIALQKARTSKKATGGPVRGMLVQVPAKRKPNKSVLIPGSRPH